MNSASSKKNSLKRKYKALILDVDGTLIPNSLEGVPSLEVAKAIKKASSLIHIGIATARPLFRTTHVTNFLGIKDASILNDGAQIIDIGNNKILKEIILDKDYVFEIVKIGKKYRKPLIINDDEGNVFSLKKYKPVKPFLMWFYGLEPSYAEEFLKILPKRKDVSFRKALSWRKNKIDIIITHSKATKKHALLEMTKLLNFKKDEIIGVGDGHNDIPLLSACGLKIAMGNATPELKKVADYVCPSVDEDGVAHIINKFIL